MTVPWRHVYVAMSPGDDGGKADDGAEESLFVLLGSSCTSPMEVES